MRAAIDKLDGIFHEEVNIEQLQRRAQELGLRFTPERIGSERRWAIRFGNENGEHIHIELRFQNSTHSRKLISNPSRFRTFRGYKNFLFSLFGRNESENVRILRMDFCIDIESKFSDMIQWIRVPYKRINRADINKNKTKTGITFGRGDLIICVYDKTEEQRRKGIELDRDVTRIEVRLSRDKLPIQYIYELPGLLGLSTEGRSFTPFSFVSIEPVRLEPIERFSTPPLLNAKAVDRLINRVRLDTYLNVGGLDLARKQMNVHGNFNRDVRGLVTFEEYPHDLDSVLMSHLESFFGRQRSQGRSL